MVPSTSTKFLFFLLLLHLLLLLQPSYCKSPTCIETEKQALLTFKEVLSDPSNHLSSWSTQLQENCCLWTGVVCNRTTSLISDLRLGSASLGGDIADSLTNLTSIKHLDLSGNDFKGVQIPTFLGLMDTLEHLNLSNSGFIGPIALEFGNLSSLRVLSLASNDLVGPLPISIGSLSRLEILVLDNTALSGIVYEAHFINCTKLKTLNATSTSLIFNFSSNWVPPFQIENAFLSYTQLGPKFPSWLQSQLNLNYLYVAYSSIEDAVPTWFWSWVSGIHHVDLTGNQIYGDISNATINSTMIRLSSNRFTGQLPSITPNVRWLTLRNNSLTGNLTGFLCSRSHRLNNMQQLSLQMNNISGQIPDCWQNWQSMIILNLAWNQFSGPIPSSMGHLQALRGLHLHRNNLTGEIPASLRNLTSIFYVNLEHNEISGEIPHWFGESYTELSVLSLSSNKVSGSIPTQLCNLPSLLVLGLADNQISGTIPRCLNNLTLMATTKTPENFTLDIVVKDDKGNLVDSFTEYLEFYSKGSIRLYDKTLELIRIIDFSGNQLSGSIPNEVCDLKGLRFLNLSSNQLSGSIPTRIGEVESLESLDVSMNLLGGSIPESMAKLTALNSLNLSYNDLQGEVPRSTQLQSFKESSFAGNVGLCGAPTGVKCASRGNGVEVEDEDGGGFDFKSFFSSMGFGFATGFVVASVVFFLMC